MQITCHIVYFFLWMLWSACLGWIIGDYHAEIKHLRENESSRKEK